jgi:hypothetical protein
LSFESKFGSSNGRKGTVTYRTNLSYRTSQMTQMPLAICTEEKAHTDWIHHATRTVMTITYYDQMQKDEATEASHMLPGNYRPTPLRAYRDIEHKGLEKREGRCTGHPKFKL